MKSAFSLLTAIIFIVVLATISALSLSLSSQSLKQTGDLYLNIQAELLARSATELAILEVTKRNTPIKKISFSYPNNTNKVFDINMSIQYFENLETGDLNRSFLIDTYVKTAEGIASEPIRIHRRSLQRP